MKTICHLTITEQTSIPRLLRESKSAIDANYKVVIVSPGESFIDSNGIIFVGVPIAKSRLQRVTRTNKQIISESLKTNADIYQIHDPELLRFSFLLKRKGARVIFDSHEFYDIQILTKPYIPKRLRKLIRNLYLIYETFILRRIDYTIGVCTIDGINHFEHRNINNILVENFPYIESKTVNTIAEKKQQIIYAGLLSENRGTKNLIKAAYKANIRLVLCGSWQSEEYEKTISNMEEFNIVEYLGVIPKSELEIIYAESLIGMSTLLFEGQYHTVDTLPTKVFEYMQAGLPVIVSKTNYFVESNRELPFGIAIDPYNIQEITEAIIKLIHNEPLREELGNNGRLLAHKKYNWLEEVKKLLKVYEELLT
jgi:glycosyltransferase involved in cell wall biosynthesis